MDAPRRICNPISFHPSPPLPHSLTNATQYAQELLSTFSTSLGEVALQPATGGVFVVEIITAATTTTTATTATAVTAAATAAAAAAAAQTPDSSSNNTAPAPSLQRSVLWDRKTDGGFPETKELKRRVRDVIQPGRDLGHVDRDYGGKKVREVMQGEGEGDRKENGKKEVGGGEGEEVKGGKVCEVEGDKCEDCE
jgi:predicted Rdx family selenoprotein